MRSDCRSPSYLRDFAEVVSSEESCQKQEEHSQVGESSEEKDRDFEEEGPEEVDERQVDEVQVDFLAVDELQADVLVAGELQAEEQQEPS